MAYPLGRYCAARHTPNPDDPVEPLFARFNVTVDEHRHDIAVTIEGLCDVD